MTLHAFKTWLRGGMIVFLLPTQIALAKNKTDFDIDRFHEQVKNNEVVYNASNGNQVREIEMPTAFAQREYDKSGNYIFYREFTKDGMLQKEGKFAKVAKQEIPIGEWKTFDKKGKVIETKNHEEGFKITYDDILDICKKRNIDLTDRLSTLIRSAPGVHPNWVIGWNSLPPRPDKTSANDRSPTTRMELIVVDGITGEIKESAPYVPFKN
jgi:hypothetical protein